MNKSLIRLYPAVLAALFAAFQVGCQSNGSADPQSGVSQPAAVLNAATVPTASGARPAWIYDPSPGDGTFGGVGSARRHIDGFSAQRQMAVGRAIDEIARQLGVSVSNFMRTETKLTGNDVQSSMDLYSIQTTNGQVVQARIRAFWETPEGDELFVWMTTL